MKDKREKNFPNKNKKNLFQRLLVSKDNQLLKEVVIAAIAVFAIAFFVFCSNYQKREDKKEISAPTPIKVKNIKEKKSEDVAASVDMADWKIYQNQWYGFELKYPENWKKPIFKKGNSGSKWKYRYQFRKEEIKKDNPYIGFDVVIYDVDKVKELKETEEFPLIKSEEVRTESYCEEIVEYLFEYEGYPDEEIYISPKDDCYNQAFFYTLTSREYIYNLIPIFWENRELPSDLRDMTIEYFPEFFSVASSFNLIDIKKPKLQSTVRRATAPMPVWYKVVNGRKICAKSNDHPGKSTRGKKKHLDMECCLDPDEYPNPNCYYSPGKYGKYL